MQLADPSSGAPASAALAYVIEVDDAQVGVVSRRAQERAFTFIAATAAVHALDGQRFATPFAAERAARDLARRQRRAA